MIAQLGSVIYPPEPTKEGYDFRGWRKNLITTEHTKFVYVDEDQTVYALWEQKHYETTPIGKTSTQTIAGGEPAILTVWMKNCDPTINFDNKLIIDNDRLLKEINFEIIDPDHCLQPYPTTSYTPNWNASVSTKAVRAGTATIIARIDTVTFHTCTIVVTSDWNDYLAYENWKTPIVNQIASQSTDIKTRMDLLKNYIQTNFKYSYHQPKDYIHAHTTMLIDCWGSAQLFGDLAKDLDAKIKYVSQSGEMFDTFNLAVGAEGSHICNAVQINNEWINYDAQPQVYIDQP